jgi:spermidine dehydrogenase
VKRGSEEEDRLLGMNKDVTRRDFLNSALLGSGTALLSSACPAHLLAQTDATALATGRIAKEDFTGYGGVGDYAESNGNTLAVLQAAHRIRDGFYQQSAPLAEDTGEVFDLVIVGGGLSGLMAAHEYAKQSGSSKTCMILENHPMFGGEARQNDFDVDGYHLIGPQGSNDFSPPKVGSGTLSDVFFTDFKIPREYSYQEWDRTLKPLRFALDNYSNMDGLQENEVDVAYYFDSKNGVSKPYFALNIWDQDLKNTPFSERARQDLRAWRNNSSQTGDEDPRVLDTMTYKHYLEVVKGYDPDVTRFSQPMVGLLGGAGSDVISARMAHQLVEKRRKAPLSMSYPGGNTIFSRYLVAGLIPGSIRGGVNFNDVMTQRVDFAALDRDGNSTRMRLGTTVTRVEHQNHDPSMGMVLVSYEKGGKVYRVRARATIMASGGWINKHLLADMPADLHAAYKQFNYVPALIANVALHNWQFLYRLGSPAVRWMDDGTMFGYCANVRRTMVTDDYHPPLHPDKPALFTFYMGLYTPGHSLFDQGALGRMRLLSTSYGEYERIIRRQMTMMFSDYGFDPARDIAGIILNRWGHARLAQPPNFFYSPNGQPSPREVVARGYGRIAIGHSELNGEQHYAGAFEHGKRAAEQVLKFS